MYFGHFSHGPIQGAAAHRGHPHERPEGVVRRQRVLHGLGGCQQGAGGPDQCPRFCGTNSCHHVCCHFRFSALFEQVDLQTIEQGCLTEIYKLKLL